MKERLTVKEMVERDLGDYDQENPYPRSLTVVEGKYWRHYELGPIHGLLVFNDFLGDEGTDEHFFVTMIEEDDEYWFASEHPMYMAAGWIDAVGETWKRMMDWKKKHLLLGWDNGADVTDPSQYHMETRGPIVPEVVPWSNDDPGNSRVNRTGEG